MTIKLIALDLDGTTLDKNGRLSEGNRQALMEAAERGVKILVATGRPLCALPDDILNFEPIRYVLTSNGARIVDLRENRTFYENCLAPNAVEAAVKLLEPLHYVLETFVNGEAYIEGWYYRQVEETCESFRNVNYILNTRKPKDDFYAFMLENREHIENINVNFEDVSEKPAMKVRLEALPDVTITSSFEHNLEIGGSTTSKGNALRHMGELLGISPSEMMAVGDSPNDLAMLRETGFPIAVGNAKEEVKKEAVYVAAPHYEDGVADAVRKFVLTEKSGVE
ncbi:MAG: Cof-type HAD-IIB family hydrolase [Clostridiales bacterium]|nr:Cof-type HAD-IIB family hydrolase [Clostridiales bacterium]MDD7036196.1 HAD family hydrolase [Bacillota bacterium]MDY2920739.1 HAD family hydrolase [Lentihominibacter sp.]